MPSGLAHQPPIRRRGFRRRYMHDCIVTVGRDDFAGAMAQPDGVAAGADGPDAASDLIAEHADAALRRAEVLQAVDRDRPLRDLGLVVAGVPLTFLVGIRGELAGEHDVAVGPPFRGPTFGLADMPELDEHCVRVVLGHDPAAHHRATEGMLLAAIFPNRRHLAAGWARHSRPSAPRRCPRPGGWR